MNAWSNTARHGRIGLSFALIAPIFFQDIPKTEATPKTDPAVEQFRKEEAEALSKLNRELGEKHYKLAKWCEKTKLMHRARYHYLRAISYNPDHEGARKVLGFKKSGSSWASPKEASFKVDDEDKIAPPEREEDVNADWKSFQTQYIPILQFRAEHDMKLAEKAKKAGLPKEELRILRRITEYHPDYVEARNKLKDIRETRDALSSISAKGKDFWIAPDLKKILDKAKVEGPLKEKNDDEQRLKLPFVAYQTPRFRIAGGIPDDFAQTYVRNAEAGYRYIMSLNPEITMPNPEGQRQIEFFVFIGPDDHRRAIESIIRVGEMQMKQLTQQQIVREPFRCFLRHVGLEEKSTSSDLFFHFGAEYAMSEIFPGIPSWLQEGLSYMVTQDLNDTCHTTCLSQEKGTQVETVDHWRQTNAWRDLLVESVLLGEDPPAKSIFEANFKKLQSKGGVKAWSMVAFLRDRDPEAFASMLKDVSTRISPTAAIDRLYKLSDRGLDVEWHEWVLKTY